MNKNLIINAKIKYEILQIYSEVLYITLQWPGQDKHIQMQKHKYLGQKNQQIVEYTQK